jgi:hypothetical protein
MDMKKSSGDTMGSAFWRHINQLDNTLFEDGERYADPIRLAPELIKISGFHAPRLVHRPLGRYAVTSRASWEHSKGGTVHWRGTRILGIPLISSVAIQEPDADQNTDGGRAQLVQYDPRRHKHPYQLINEYDWSLLDEAVTLPYGEMLNRGGALLNYHDEVMLKAGVWCMVQSHNMATADFMSLQRTLEDGAAALQVRHAGAGGE